MDIIGKSPVPLPVLIVGKLALLGSWIFFLAKLLGADVGQYESRLARITGIALFLIGFAMVIAAILQLGQSIAVGIPERDTDLKTRGLYAFTRNPIYLGAFVMCAGSCLYSINIVNVLLFAVAVTAHVVIVEREEEFLEQRFGRQWMEYRQRVPRFIGIVRRG